MKKANYLLRYYLRTIWEKAGLKWDSDNDAEVDEIIDDIENTISDEIEGSEARTEVRNRYKVKG
jgi:hypothetical protein